MQPDAGGDGDGTRRHDPLLGSGRYVNYLSDDDLTAVPDSYGPNLERLANIKRQYDPGNRFHLNHNISPAV